MHQDAAFRRPTPPKPIETFDVPHPAVPEALDGFRVLHFSDLHIRSRMDNRRWFADLTRAIRETPVDLVALTGDYMDHPGNEQAAIHVLDQLSRTWSTRFGALGVFGNHDTTPFRIMARRIDGIRWLDHEAVMIDNDDGGRLRVLGTHWPEDLPAALLNVDATNAVADGFTLTLVHIPTMIVPAADLALPLLLAGHTHAGQVRISPKMAPHTSSDISPHLASGILRLRRTLCCVSRGLGEAVGEHLRLNCPRHVPLYTLRRAPLPNIGRQGSVEVVNQVVAW